MSLACATGSCLVRQSRRWEAEEEEGMAVAGVRARGLERREVRVGWRVA
jgi:hypothetical protein